MKNAETADLPVSGPVAASITEFDPGSPDEIRRVAELYEMYVFEEFDRTGDSPGGIPAALYLRTFLVRVGNEIAGLCSFDPKRCSVELIYVEPQARRQGLGRALLTHIRAVSRAPILLKAPVSPSGRALARTAGLGVAQLTAEEIDKAARYRQEARRSIKAICHHKHGNPSRGCRRCCRKVMKQAARVTVYLGARDQRRAARERR